MALPDPASGLPVGVAFFFASQTLQFDSVWYFLVVRHVGTKPRYPEEVREEGTPPCLTHFDHSVQICVDLLCYAVVVHVLGTSWHILEHFATNTSSTLLDTKQSRLTKPAGCAMAPQPSPTTYPSAVALKGAEWPTRDSLWFPWKHVAVPCYDI